MSSMLPVRRSLLVAMLAALFALLCAVPGDAQAQPQLNFKRIINNWPTIELYFMVGCNGQEAYFTDKKYFSVVENGLDVGAFELWCPDPTMRCAMSAALVFDASGSMLGSGNDGAKAAGNAFASMMDDITDEAAVLWFNSVVYREQGMTTSREQLHAAVNALPARDSSAVWDGIYQGALELINNGVNQCRAVIVLTDGQDNASSRGIPEIILLANRNRVRVFTIGLGSAINGTQLSWIANMTGGRYYETPSVAQLVAIYQEITTIMFGGGWQECLVTYTASCMDGSTRTVDLTLQDFCGGSDTKTKTYKALRDSSIFTPLRLRIGTTEARGNANAAVPLQLLDPVADGTILQPATFTVLFDETCARFVSIATPPGSLLEGVPITVAPIAGGVVLTTTDRKMLAATQPPATLAELRFATGDPGRKDTVFCPVKLSSWTFSTGCFKPLLQDGGIVIDSRQPIVSCAIAAPPSLTWVRSSKNYSPNPFRVGMTLSNTGVREARNARFRIIYSSSDLSLVAPATDTLPGTPPNVDPGATYEVHWDLLAKHRLVGDSVRVCIQATFDNHDPVECCANVWIPPMDAMLDCRWFPASLIIPVDALSHAYKPMPFTIDATVTNTGGRRTDTVFATITVPKDLRLYGPDAPDRNTKRILPAILSPGQSGGVSWTLWHPPSPIAKKYRVVVCFKTSNADSTCCEVEVVIPPLESPMIYPSCSAPDSLHFDESLNAYVPNPFTAGMTVTNVGGREARNARFRILYNVFSLTPLTPAADTLAGTPPIVSTGGQSEAHWQLGATRRAVGDSVNICIRATFDNHDSVECRRKVWIPAAQAKLTAQGSTTFCEGDSVRLAATPGFKSYLWSTGRAGTSILVRQTGAYWCRVWDVFGRQKSTDTVLVTVNPTPRPRITPSGYVQICEGSSVTLSVEGTYRAYRWSNGDTTREISVDRAGVFAVTVTDAHSCTGSSDSVTVAVAPLPSVAITGPQSLCPSSTATYRSAHVDNVTKHWTVSSDGRIAGSASGDSVLVDWHGPGARWVAVTQQQGTPACTVSDTLRVTVSPEIILYITVIGSTALCEGDSAILDAKAGFTSYLWSNGAQTRTIVVTQSGTYTVTVTDLLGCSHLSLPLLITTHPRPPVPVISRSGDQLTATAGPWTYQWSKDGADIPGETNDTLTLSGPGNYRVTITDSIGCSSISDPFQIAVGIEAQAPSALQPEVFPDPSTGAITVRVPARAGETVRITVVDMLGRELLRSEDVCATDQYQSALRLMPATPGTYSLHVACGDRRWVRSLRVY